MKKQFNPLLGGLALSASVLALSAVWVSEASAGIAATKHNLGSTTNTANNRFQSTNPTALNAEICVFCHTPHGGDTNAAVPLWNKALPTGGYTLYSSGSLQAARASDGIAAQPQIGSVSIACLSCHDGSQAMNNFINQPGSGGFTATGATMAGSWTAGTGTATPVNTDGTLGSGVGNLTKDLRNDHPIGIAYCGGSPSTNAGPNANNVFGTCPDTDFNNNVSGNGQGTLQVVLAGQGANTVWYIEKSVTPNGRQKTDLPLYTRNFGGTNGPSVECGTCHDPHTDAQPMFLRTNNSGSAVCQSCHVK